MYYENKTPILLRRAHRVPVSIHIDPHTKGPIVADALEIRTLVLNRKWNNQTQWQASGLSHLTLPAASHVSTYVFKCSKAIIRPRAQPGLFQAVLICSSLETQKGCQHGHCGREPTGNQDPLSAERLLLTSLLPYTGVCTGGGGWGSREDALSSRKVPYQICLPQFGFPPKQTWRQEFRNR